MNTRVYIELFIPEELDQVIERGSPLGFMLKYSVVLLDRGCSSMVRSRPKITEYTMKTLRRSILAALGLVIEHYYLEMLRVSFTPISLNKTLDQVSLLTLRRC